MVTDKQVRILMKLISKEKTLVAAAAQAGMCEKPPANIANQASFPANASLFTPGEPGRTHSKKMIGD